MRFIDHGVFLGHPGHFRFSSGSSSHTRIVFQPRSSAAPSGQLAVRRHSGQLIIRTTQHIDEYQRVNFDVVNLKPFACVAFPLSHLHENTVKQPDFGDELVTSVLESKPLCGPEVNASFRRR